MKKRFTVLLTVMCLICALGLTACGNSGDIAVKSITLDQNEITLTEGESITLIATLLPNDATNVYMEWTSSDPSVASVDSGSVTALAAGNATVTVTSHNGKTAVCSVTVIEKQPDPVAQYDVKFEANGGKFDNGKDTVTVKVNHGDKLPDITVTRDGYVLAGWYTTPSLSYLWNDDTDTVDGDTILYAGWKYINAYQSVTDALAAKIKAYKDTESDVEILSVFVKDGALCFVEKDGTGVFSYKTDITDFTAVKGNTQLVAQIPDATLTELDSYNGAHTSDNDYGIASTMAIKYAGGEYEAIYSSVSDWEDDNNEHITGSYYKCSIKAVIADEDGNVYSYTATVVAGVDNFDLIISGNALSTAYDDDKSTLGEVANDFYAERLKEKQA